MSLIKWQHCRRAKRKSVKSRKRSGVWVGFFLWPTPQNHSVIQKVLKTIEHLTEFLYTYFFPLIHWELNGDTPPHLPQFSASWNSQVLSKYYLCYLWGRFCNCKFHRLRHTQSLNSKCFMKSEFPGPWICALYFYHTDNVGNSSETEPTQSFMTLRRQQRGQGWSPGKCSLLRSAGSTTFFS